MITRRLLGASVLAAVALRSARAADTSDVLIIGAGLAGLYAGLMLQDAGMKVRVL